MRQQLSEELQLKFPKLFLQGARIECGDGWFNLVDAFCEVLQSDINPYVSNPAHIIKINSSYGSINIELSENSHDFSPAIRLAVKVSRSIREF